MNIRLSNYRYGYKVVSLSLDKCTAEELEKSCLSYIYAENETVRLMPEGLIISNDSTVYCQLLKCNNYDVFEIWDNGVMIRRYDDKSDDNYFFITNVCNSNCIICPSSEASRRKTAETDMNSLMEIARHIPSDTPHLTITGGEPFMVGEKIFPFINFLKEKFTNTEFLFLTNGRVFAISRYVDMFKESMPFNSITAVPIHGSCGEIHDKISQTKHSFLQAKQGVKNLLRKDIKVELRLVVNRLNIDDFENIANLIINEFKGISYVSIMAMEMTGCARTNKDKVWIPYRKSFGTISGAIHTLISSGVDVKLYNFPLCTVNRAYWTLCKKSISPNKVMYADICKSCRHKKGCGGVFAGTFQIERNELRATL